MNTPIKVAELEELSLGARDFLYLKDEKLLIIAMSDMNIASRFDAYLTNVSIAFNAIVFFPMGEKRGKS